MRCDRFQPTSHINLGGRGGTLGGAGCPWRLRAWDPTSHTHPPTQTPKLTSSTQGPPNTHDSRPTPQRSTPTTYHRPHHSPTLSTPPMPISKPTLHHTKPHQTTRLHHTAPHRTTPHRIAPHHPTSPTPHASHGTNHGCLALPHVTVWLSSGESQVLVCKRDRMLVSKRDLPSMSSCVLPCTVYPHRQGTLKW